MSGCSLPRWDAGGTPLTSGGGKLVPVCVCVCACVCVRACVCVVCVCVCVCGVI